MASALPPLESRILSSGLARRTSKNLDFIKKNASSTEAHPVTQVVNSLLGLLVFPVEKEKLFLATFSKVKFKDPSNLSGIRAALIQHLPVPSVQVAKLGGCENLSRFFKSVRNAVSHKHMEFSGPGPAPGPDPDSRILADVTVNNPKSSSLRPALKLQWVVVMSVEIDASGRPRPFERGNARGGHRLRSNITRFMGAAPFQPLELDHGLPATVATDR